MQPVLTASAGGQLCAASLTNWVIFVSRPPQRTVYLEDHLIPLCPRYYTLLYLLPRSVHIVMIDRWLVLSDQQSKIQRYLVYNDIKQRKTTTTGTSERLPFQFDHLNSYKNDFILASPLYLMTVRQM